MRAFLFIVVGTFVACGGQVMGGADGGDTDGPIGADVIKPPPPPPPPPPPADLCNGATSCSAVFVMRFPYLGDMARGSMMTSTVAWKTFGENIDGKVSDAKSTDVCTRSSGAPSSVQSDGNQGIDNSFGANIVPIVQSAGSIPNPSQAWAAQIANGKSHTLLFTVDVKGTSVSAQLLLAAPLGKPAAFDGTDVWPISDLAFENAVSKVSFPNATVGPDYVLVSGRSTQRTLVTWDFNGVGWPIPVDGIQIRLKLASGLGSASEGNFSGMLPTDAFIDSLKQTSGNISKSLCGSAFDGIAQQLRQTQDILGDGSNSQGVPCNAISFGMGFEVAKAKLGAPATETIANSCP